MSNLQDRTISYTEWFYDDVNDWNDLTREEVVARFGEASIAAAETILLQNPNLTVGLHFKRWEILIGYDAWTGEREEGGSG